MIDEFFNAIEAGNLANVERLLKDDPALIHYKKKVSTHYLSFTSCNK
jgi:hypothetical protein